MFLHGFWCDFGMNFNDSLTKQAQLKGFLQVGTYRFRQFGGTGFPKKEYILYKRPLKSVIFSLQIFIISLLPKCQTQGRDVLRQYSPTLCVRCQMSRVTCHLSHIIYQISHTICHMSHATCHMTLFLTEVPVKISSFLSVICFLVCKYVFQYLQQKNASSSVLCILSLSQEWIEVTLQNNFPTPNTFSQAVKAMELKF